MHFAISCTLMELSIVTYHIMDLERSMSYSLVSHSLQIIFYTNIKILLFGMVYYSI